MANDIILPDEYDRIHLDLAPFFALPRSEMHKSCEPTLLTIRRSPLADSERISADTLTPLLPMSGSDGTACLPIVSRQAAKAEGWDALRFSKPEKILRKNPKTTVMPILTKSTYLPQIQA
jgi:hypothetical protein